MLHPLYGKLCLAMLFRRPFRPPLMVFLPLMPLRLLLCVKCTCCTSHTFHDVSSWWIGASCRCPRFWTLVQLWKVLLLLIVPRSFRLYPSLDSFFKQQCCFFGFFRVHLGVLWWWFVKTPDDYYLITLCWISSVVWHMLSQHISGRVTVCDPSIMDLFAPRQVLGCFGTS